MDEEGHRQRAKILRRRAQEQNGPPDYKDFKRQIKGIVDEKLKGRLVEAAVMEKVYLAAFSIADSFIVDTAKIFVDRVQEKSMFPSSEQTRALGATLSREIKALTLYNQDNNRNINPVVLEIAKDIYRLVYHYFPNVSIPRASGASGPGAGGRE